MAQYIDKSALVAEIKRLLAFYSKEIEDCKGDPWAMDIAKRDILQEILSFIDTLEVKDPYITCIQYTNREAAIKAHAEDYSWNIESELFQQLTPEQQKLWRKEIEQACISGGYGGLNLAKDPRYKENLEVKEVDLEKHLKEDIEDVLFDLNGVAVKGATQYLTVEDVAEIARHFADWQKKQLFKLKEDIRDWVKEAVRQEAAKLIAKTYDDYDVKREIRDMLRSPYDSIRKDIVSAAATEICKHVKLVVDKPIKED